MFTICSLRVERQMNTAEMTELMNTDQLLDALKACGLVNITYCDGRTMICGNPLYNLPMLDVSCGDEDQAWAINRAKEAIGRGDEAAARVHLAPLIPPLLH
jgi:hypothetical protein